MEQRISFLTLAVRDLEASRRFYVDGLGWTPDVEVEVIPGASRDDARPIARACGVARRRSAVGSAG